MSIATDRSEDIRNDVAKIKRLLGLDVNRLAIGSDFETTLWRPIGIGINSFVNVSTSIVTGTQTGT